MSFLTPFYLAGLLAVSLPLVFHLIRRTPKGRFPFSSLMFLSPSPPRLTRRSRLDNVLLLLLRAAALVLLAFAFARPLLRAAARLGVEGPGGRRVAVLVDTSASMQRDGLWGQVIEKVDALLHDLGPGDDVALYRFDCGLEVLVPFDDPTPLDPSQKIARVQTAIKATSPGWAGSSLDQALIAVADEVNHIEDATGPTGQTTRQIVLLSDLQEGSRVESLRTYVWPEDVQLTVHTVATAKPTNAGLHLAAALDEPTDGDERAVRVRVSNAGDSAGEQFQLRWDIDGNTAASQEPVSVYVPPGESRVVRVSRPPDPAIAERLLLTGDDHAFDNALYVVPIEKEEVPLIYIGSDAENDPAGLRYYLERAFPETARRKVCLVVRKPEEPIGADDVVATRLIVVGEAVPEERVEPLRDYLLGGGTVLIVLKDAAAGRSLARLLGLDDLGVEDGGSGDYAMLSEIAFSDPLFAAFADPRFNDFTKIHFWKHRRVDVADVPNLRVLARFDDGDPALFEQTHGQGRLLVLTSGWHPADSQLARSTKFVPLLSGMLERSAGRERVLPQYEVGEPVLLPAQAVPEQHGSVRAPGGTILQLAAGARRFDDTNEPGVYGLSLGDVQPRFAVNVPAAESKTAPVEADQLAELGVRLGRRPTRAELAERLRQMRDVELENRQKLWRWLILATLGMLILETWLAGSLSRRAVQPVETGQ